MVYIRNVHHRTLKATPAQLGALMASLASTDDRLWSHQWWPAMRFDRPLAVGAIGGHGPIRYFVESYSPNECIIFRFTAPRGFDGTHAYYIHPLNPSETRLEHVLEMNTSGPALLSWPLIFRPLHDALIEDSLDVAMANLELKPLSERNWSFYVRLLRALLRRRPRS